MKVLKIEPKDRLTEYTHIEIKGITIPADISTVVIHTKLNGVEGRGTIDLDNKKYASSLYVQVNELIKG